MRGGCTSAGVATKLLIVAGIAAWSVAAAAQVITVDTRTGAVTANGTTTNTVDRRFQQIKPTNVKLAQTELDAKTRLELIRLLEAEQGFAMRPLPKGHKGLTIAANGGLEPYGEAYLAMVTSQGISVPPGERLILTNVRIDKTHIIFDINGGPDPKHRFLRHVQIGAGSAMGPVMQDNEPEPAGSRLTLSFEHFVPLLTAAEVKALIAPVVSFDLKSPVQAFTDTLPEKLKEAILGHKVLVGMSTEMLLYSKGAPRSKSREIEGQLPFEEWIYGEPPQAVEFVRINGNRVLRYEVARVGESPVIYSEDVVSGMMREDGTPAVAPPRVRVSQVGDLQRDPDTQSQAAPPSLRKEGEKLPDLAPADQSMGPVRFPKQSTEKPVSAPSADTPASTGPTSTSPTSASPTGTGQPSPQAQPAPTMGTNPDGPDGV